MLKGIVSISYKALNLHINSLKLIFFANNLLDLCKIFTIIFIRHCTQNIKEEFKFYIRDVELSHNNFFGRNFFAKENGGAGIKGFSRIGC